MSVGVLEISRGESGGLSGECPLGVRECVRGHLVSVGCQEMSGM